MKLNMIYRPGKGLCTPDASSAKPARGKSGTRPKRPRGATPESPDTATPTNVPIAPAGMSEASKVPASTALSPEQQLLRLKEQNRERQRRYRAKLKEKK